MDTNPRTPGTDESTRGAMHWSPEVFGATVEDFIRTDNAQGITPLLASQPPSRMQELLLHGFWASGTKCCFFEAFLRMNKFHMLRQVVQDLPPGLSTADLCRVYEHSDGDAPIIQRSMHRLAVNNAQPEALLLALQLEPDHRDLTQMLQDGPLREQVQTLHFFALNQAVSRQDFPEYLTRAAECARILRGHGAPIKNVSPHRSDIACAADAFFCDRWAPTFEAEAAVLLEEYARAGLVDVNEPFRYTMRKTTIDYVTDDKAVVPLATAIRNGCAPAAMALINLGCDISLALPEAHPEIDDIFALVRSHAHDEDVERRLTGAITEALLHRRLLSESIPDTPAPAARRARRML